MAKLVTDALLKKSVEDILTELVNSTYDWQEYTDEEIGPILELDSTQVAELSAVINDSVTATNKVYSSQHTKELIQESLIEANKYSDDLVANLSNIKLDIVDSLPDSSTVNKSTIYILKDSSGGTNNTLNVWSDTTSAFVEVGKLNVNMDNYYTKSEVDTELAKKANADEVLKPDAIVADLTTTSGSTTLSTAGLQTELDKKANDDEVVKKTDIVTTIDSTSTDTKVPSGKLLYNELLKVSNDNYIEDANNPTSFICKTDSNTLNTPYKEGLTTATISLVISAARGSDQWNGQISISMASTDFFIRDRGGKGWNPWVKLMTKNDITTTINSTSTDETIPTSKAVETRVKDRLRNADNLFSTDALGISIEFNKEYTLEKSMYDYTFYDGQINWTQTSVSRRGWYDNDWDILILTANSVSDTLSRTYILRLLISHSNGKVIKFLNSKYVSFNLADGSFSTGDIKTGINIFALR